MIKNHDTQQQLNNIYITLIRTYDHITHSVIIGNVQLYSIINIILIILYR